MKNLTVCTAVSIMMGMGALVYPQIADAKVILKETVKYYSVRGRTGREIFQDMVKNGPRVGRREDQHALATTEYQYAIKNFEAEMIRGRCVAKNLDVVMKVTYTYPKWVGNSGAKRTTRNAWKKFKTAVIWHEKQHVKIAMEFAREYENALRKGRQRKCESASVSSQLRTMGAAFRHSRKQKAFDRRDLKPGGRGYEAQVQLFRAE